MRFKVGDRVKIVRPNLNSATQAGGFVEKMNTYEGYIGKIILDVWGNGEGFKLLGLPQWTWDARCLVLEHQNMEDAKKQAIFDKMTYLEEKFKNRNIRRNQTF